jgi:hypothetical protein
MASPATNGLAGRIAAVEIDLLTENLDDIRSRLQEILEGKRDPEEREWLADRLRCTKKHVDRLREAQERVVAGEFRPVFFAVMERFFWNEYEASSRIVSKDPHKVAKDLEERIIYYKRALEYSKIANELLGLMATQ